MTKHAPNLLSLALATLTLGVLLGGCGEPASLGDPVAPGGPQAPSNPVPPTDPTPPSDPTPPGDPTPPTPPPPPGDPTPPSPPPSPGEVQVPWQETNPAPIPAPPAGESFLSDLPWSEATNGNGPVERDRSGGGSGAGDGAPLTLGGQVFAKGLGVHAESAVIYDLGGACRTLNATVGLDDEVRGQAGGASVVFEVTDESPGAGGRVLWSSGTLRATDGVPAVISDLNISGVGRLGLHVRGAGDGTSWDHADWGAARVTCDPSPQGPGGAWKLSFQDEFAGPALDRARWNTRNFERYDVDGKARFLAWYPQEALTPGERNVEGRTQVAVADGQATITAAREATPWFAGQSWARGGQGFPYSSGIIQTAPVSVNGKLNASVGFEQRYGFFEARLRGPSAGARGSDGGFWLYSRAGWPPEIDVVEMPGASAGGSVLSNVHWQDAGGKKEAWQYLPVRSDGWHTYGLLWQPGLLVWYIDGGEVRRYTGPGVPDVPMFLNVAFEVNGGAGDNFYGDPAAGVWPQTLDVDYVRAWTK